MKSGKEFIQDGLEKAQLDEYLEQELERAGYAGMSLDETTQGMRVVIRAEKPGMVIGSGGKNIRELTRTIEEDFSYNDVSIDVQDVEVPDLEANIVADKLANALERGWYFREAGQTTVERVMENGAQGVLVMFSGKLMGARSSVEKFERGYIKHNGQPSKEIVEHGEGTAVMPLGSIGVSVDLIPPSADLPDEYSVKDNVDLEEKLDGEFDSLLNDEDDSDDDSDDSSDDSSEHSDGYQEEVIDDDLDEEVIA